MIIAGLGGFIGTCLRFLTNLISPSMNVLLITGFCGGFTTYSSMADDMYLLLQQRHWIYFGTYVGLTLLLGILMVYLGRSLIKAS